MPSCHLILIFYFWEQSFLFGVKTSCAQALLHVSKNKSWLSECTAHSLSFCLSVSPRFPLSACFFLLERMGGGHSWQLPKMDPKWCTSAHIAIWHTAGTGGGRHFEFVSSSAQLGSCQTAEVAQVPGGWDAIGEPVLVWKSKDVRPQDHFSPRCCITIYKSDRNPVLPPQHPFSFLFCVPQIWCQFWYLFSACVSLFPCLHISAILLIMILWYQLLGNFRDLIVVSTSLCLGKLFVKHRDFQKVIQVPWELHCEAVPNTGLNQELPLPIMLLPLMQYWWPVKKYIKIKSVLHSWSRIWIYSA